jgi:hypothetical protein
MSRNGKTLRHLGLVMFLTAVLGSPFPAQEETSGSEETLPLLKPEEAERLFLGYIYNPSHLMRNCMFLGGVKIGEVTYKGTLATAEIRYRIECRMEEIEAPPLDRTLKEDFLYRYVTDYWEMLGRATEVAPSLKGEVPPPEVPSAAAPDPFRGARKMIAEVVLTWVALGTPPPGIDAGFPGGKFFAATDKILVSSENLPGLETLTVKGKDVLILSPEALLQRTVLMGGGIWLRFESLNVSDVSAHALIAIAAPVLPGPRPGGDPIRTLSRISADFYRRKSGWTMTRFRPI